MALSLSLYNPPAAGNLFFVKNPIILQATDSLAGGDKMLIIEIINTSPDEVIFTKSAPLNDEVLIRVDDILQEFLSINFNNIITSNIRIIPEGVKQIELKGTIENRYTGELLFTRVINITVFSGGIPPLLFSKLLSEQKNIFDSFISVKPRAKPLFLRNNKISLGELKAFPYLFFITSVSSPVFYKIYLNSVIVISATKNPSVFTNGSFFQINIQALINALDPNIFNQVIIEVTLNSSIDRHMLLITPENELKRPQYFIFRNIFDVFEVVTLFSIIQRKTSIESEENYLLDILTDLRTEVQQTNSIEEHLSCETGPLDKGQMYLLKHFLASEEIYLNDSGTYKKIILDTKELLIDPYLQQAESQTIDFHFANDNTDIINFYNPDAIAVESITLNKKSVLMIIGESERLTAVITPENATDKTIIWTSDKPEIATVSFGKVTAISTGTTIIRVTTTDGSISASCLVSVIPANRIFDNTFDITFG